MFVKRKTYDLLVTDHSDTEAVLSEAIASNADLTNRLRACAVVIEHGDNRSAFLQAELDVAHAKVSEAQSRLAKIIAMETPGMANIGKKMIRAAKGIDDASLPLK